MKGSDTCLRFTTIPMMLDYIGTACIPPSSCCSSLTVSSRCAKGHSEREALGVLDSRTFGKEEAEEVWRSWVCNGRGGQTVFN